MELLIKPRSIEPICHVMLNYTVHEELETHPEYIAKLRQCQKINLHNSAEFDIIELQAYQTNVDWLHYLRSRKYRYAVIWFDGSWPTGSFWDRNLIDTLNNQWTCDDWLAAGHLINKGIKFPYWHHQCLVLNLRAWEQIGSPNIFEHPVHEFFYDVSEENLHDDYTPLFIEPDGDTVCKKFRDDYMDSVISNGIANGLKIYNLPFDLREHKYCCYPEDDIEETVTWLHDNDMVERKHINELRADGDHLGEDKEELYGFKLLKYQIVYITNTEGVPNLNHNVPYSTLVVPCSGLHQFAHISHTIKTAKNVIWFDFNPYSVKWIQHLIENWDGTDFHGWFEDNKYVILDDGVILEENLIYEADLIDEFIDKQGGEEQWIKIWRKIKKLNHVYLNIDVVKEWNKLADAIGTDGIVFLQLTNIWNYEVNYLNTSGFDAQINFLKLLDTISKQNQELYFMGDTPGWYHHRNKRIKELKVLT